MRKSVLYGLIFIAIIIAYAAIVCYGIVNMQDWAYSDWNLCLLAILGGVGCAVTHSYWEQEKKSRRSKLDEGQE